MTALSGLFLLSCVLSLIGAEKYYEVMNVSLQDNIIVQALTPFDDYGNVNYALIPQLAQYYVNNKLKVIFVSGYYGAGPSLSLPERKRLVKEWSNQSNKLGFDLIVEVGSLPFVETLEFARYCSELKVTAITTFAEVVYQATTREEAVEDLQRICDASSNLPLMYYQNVIVDQEIKPDEVFKAAVEACVSCFIGALVSVDNFLNIKASVDSIDGYQFWGVGVDSIAATHKVGMNASVTIILFPKLIRKIRDAVRNCQLDQATELQQKLNRRMYAITNVNGGVVDDSTRTYFEQSKAAFELISGIDTGYRYPIERPNSTVRNQMRSNLEDLGVRLYSSNNYGNSKKKYKNNKIY